MRPIAKWRWDRIVCWAFVAAFGFFVAYTVLWILVRVLLYAL